MFVRSLSRQIGLCGRTAGRRYATAAPVSTKSTQPTSTTSDVQVFSVPPEVGTTKQILAEVDRALGPAESYKSRYPNVDAVKVFQSALQAQGPFKVDDSVRKIFELMGFDEEQTEQVISEKLPSFYKILPNGNPQVDYQVMDRLFADTPARRNVINELRASEEDRSGDLEEIKIDYDYYIKQLGKDTVEQVERETTEGIQKLIGNYDIDVEAIKTHITSLVQPSMDRMKDFLIESVPDVNLLNNDLLGLQNMADPEADLDVDAPGFLDKFAPEVRDRIFTEIDNEDYDFEFVKQSKQNRVTPETMSQFNQQYFIDKQIVFDRDLRDAIGGGSGGNARQNELINLFAEVSDTNDLNKKLEQEVQQLRNRIEMESGGGDGGAKGQDKQEGQAAEVEVSKRKKVVVRDFKHMTPEQVKEWEARSIKQRDEALQALTDTIEEGKKL